MSWEKLKEYHGCLSGDCPHEKQEECYKEMFDQGREDVLTAKKAQKVITGGHDGGAYYNFFFTPGSFESMNWFIEKGWVLVSLVHDANARRFCAVFEREAV